MSRSRPTSGAERLICRSCAATRGSPHYYADEYYEEDDGQYYDEDDAHYDNEYYDEIDDPPHRAPQHRAPQQGAQPDYDPGYTPAVKSDPYAEAFAEQTFEPARWDADAWDDDLDVPSWMPPQPSAVLDRFATPSANSRVGSDPDLRSRSASSPRMGSDPGSDPATVLGAPVSTSLRGWGSDPKLGGARSCGVDPQNLALSSAYCNHRP